MTILPIDDTEQHLAWAHPLVREWFAQHLGQPTAPQVAAWPAIRARQSVLIAAPTGAGKTLAAFIPSIDALIRQAIAFQLSDETEVIYISPLKALSNDVRINLIRPLQEIAKLAEKRGIAMQEVTIAVRTGDTHTRDRLAMIKKPPHILVTTPESFYILLTAEKSRLRLATIHTIIVDEIHAMVNDKRGTHLTLSLERLTAITQTPPIRIGLSATQNPIAMVGQFLVGSSRPYPVICDSGHRRDISLKVYIPPSELGAVTSNDMWSQIYDHIASVAKNYRATLVFVNTRRLAERCAHHLAERIGEKDVATHHGSLSPKLRHQAEQRLKSGELKVLVCTASLELGIDIGSIDLVCHIGAPRAIATALQRVGRAGHWHGAVAKGIFIATTRDELVQCAALVHAIQQGELDCLIMPQESLDILSQQLIAICATGDWQEDTLFTLVKQAYPYRNLSRETFNRMIQMLTEGIAASRGRFSAYLFRDQVNGIVKARRGARFTAIMNGGAIPETGLYTVVTESQQTVVGTLDEDFALESHRGDIILLGATSWLVKKVESKTGRVWVEDAHGAPPTVPFWRGESPGRTQELSQAVSKLRATISAMLTTPSATIATDPQAYPHCEQTIAWLQQHCGLEKDGALSLMSYILEGRAILGAVPTQETIIAERFFDEGGGMQLIIHSPFGARINKAWGLALRKRFCRSFNFELQAAATDDGINIALAEQHSFNLADVFQFLHPNTLVHVLTQAVLQSPLFKIRWRWIATRSLALPRFRRGKKVPPNIQRMLSDDLLAAVFPDAAACQDNLGGRDIELPDHPLIVETMKDALTEAMDSEGLTALIQAIQEQHIHCIAVDTPLPSVFAHEILNANPYAFLDDAPLEERRARAVEMRRILPNAMLDGVGQLDPAAIAEVQAQAWPDIRNADELHDALQTFIAFPETLATANWTAYFDALQSQGRVTRATAQQKIFWITAEKLSYFQCLYPAAHLTHYPVVMNTQRTPNAAEAMNALLKGWCTHLGPTNAQDLHELLCLPLEHISQGLLQLESTGLILRGQFTKQPVETLEWCERRLLARIHRLTINRLRQQIAPVSVTHFMRWLLQWQHVAPDTQLAGEQGLLAVIRQLQGFEAPANAWESQLFAKRIKHYSTTMLDHLCLSGVIGWGRVSPHPATRCAISTAPSSPGAFPNQRRVIATSIAPITFFIREACDWLPTPPEKYYLEALSAPARDVYHYLGEYGAAFFSDMVTGVRRLKSEIEGALWELVAAGLVSADGFDNLRAFIDPRRRIHSHKRRTRTPFSGGRWYLLPRPTPIGHERQLEAVCNMLLQRYGVVFRDLLAREKNLPRWHELVLCLRRMEDRGEIRGGRFVAEVSGEQFASAIAVESLRAGHHLPNLASSIDISTVDPLNLVGIIVPGTRIMASSGKTFDMSVYLQPTKDNKEAI